MDDQALTRLTPLRKPPFEIRSLARIPLSQLANLPDEPGIYLALDDASRVWYVGIADSIRGRLAGHDRMREFKDSGVTGISWRPENSPLLRRSLERELIEYCHPPLNAQHNFHTLPMVDLGLTPDQEIERFLRLRVQQKLIELELEQLKPNIVTRCEQAVGQKVHHRLGEIRRQTYKSWQFSAELEAKKEGLKQAQQEERQNGIAMVKAITVSPVAKLNAAVLWDEIAILINNIEKGEEIEDLAEVV